MVKANEDGYEQGRVQTVDNVQVSRRLDGDHAAGVTELVVANPYIFDEDGGYLLLGVQVYGYTTFDEDTGQVFLDAPLSLAADDGDRVYLWDPVREVISSVMMAQVVLDGQDGEPVGAEVADNLLDRLPLGTRPADGEQVLLELDDDTWRVIDILGQAGSMSDLTNSGYVDLDGPPSQLSDPTLATRLGVQIITWDGLNYLGEAMESDLDYVEVHGQSFAFTPVPGDPDTVLERLPPGPGFVVKAGNEYGVTWHYRLVAIDKSGLASTPSGEVSGATVALVDTDLIGQVIAGAHIVDGTITASDKIIANTITGTLIQALAINAGHINANSITADKIDAGAITAVKLSATAIDGKIITGAILRTASSGQRVIVRNDGSGGIIEAYAGLSGESPGYFDPIVVGGKPGLKIAPGTTSTYSAQPFIEMYSGAGTGFADISSPGSLLLSGASLISIYSSGGNVAVDAAAMSTNCPLTVGGALTLNGIGSNTSAPNLRVNNDGTVTNTGATLGSADSGGTGYRMVRVPN